MGKSGPLIFPSHSSTEQHDKQYSQSLSSESDHYSPGVAQHALVLGPGRPVLPDIIVPVQPAQLVLPALNGNLHREMHEFLCLAPRALAIRGQDISVQVAERLEALQKYSTRALYKAKMAIRLPLLIR